MKPIVANGILVAFVALNVAASGTAGAQDGEAVARAPSALEFDETYDRFPDSNATGVLAGLRFGKIDGPVDPQGIRLLLPRGTQGSVCVSAVTADSRFRSNNPFLLPSPAPQGEQVRLETITRDHTAELERYSAGEIAVHARLSEQAKGGCEAPNGLLLPRRGNEAAPDILTVLLNIGARRAKAGLQKGDDAESDQLQRCGRSLLTAQSAFDTVCSIPLGAREAGSAILTVSIRQGPLPPTERRWRVWIPANDG